MSRKGQQGKESTGARECFNQSLSVGNNLRYCKQDKHVILDNGGILNDKRVPEKLWVENMETT